MAINPDIRDQAYQFFVEEAPELLQVLEAGLLTLRQQRSTAKVHDLMRAAHSLKGGAASVELEAIATLAHRLENILKALYSETLEIDADLESLLLQAYDCLRLPLIEQITTGAFNQEAALEIADPIFSQLEERCGDLLRADSYFPSSTDLGIDMVSAIFEVDIAQGLEHLAKIVSHPQDYEVAGELRAQVEVFGGFAEFLNLPGFGAIAKAVEQALAAHPSDALEIARLALTDFERGRQIVLDHDRTQEIGPSTALEAWANTDSMTTIDTIALGDIQPISEAGESAEELAIAISQLQNTFGDASSRAEVIQPISSSTFQEDLTILPVDRNLDQPQAGQLLHLNQNTDGIVQSSQAELSPASDQTSQDPASKQQIELSVVSNLTVRVDAERLERMNNLVGELAINRDGLALQSDQLQGSLKELLSRFSQLQKLLHHLGKLSDQMLIAPERIHSNRKPGLEKEGETAKSAFADTHYSLLASFASPEFDPLEMDSYGALQTQVQEILESMMQIEETVQDITLFSRQPHQMLTQQRQMLIHLRDEIMQARMLPLSEILNRFHRILRDLSTAHQKPVRLTLIGAEVLVEKAILEKLYDPLLHLLRNAFDHGIEPKEIRQQCEKPEQGEIVIRAYHRGNQTIIEFKDDGQGLNLEQIQKRALELGLLSSEQLAVTPASRLYELIFEPGFSTVRQANKLSGRGVGLDVVRSQLRSIKGKVMVASSSQQGTMFTLQVPLTLTIANLVVCLIGNTALALPTDSIEEVITPKAGETRQSGTQRFIYWQEKITPIYRLADLVNYHCSLPDSASTKSLLVVPAPLTWELPLLILSQEHQVFALEVDTLVTEQEMVIKPFSSALTPPSYVYGCTILADGSLVPVIDGAALLSLTQEQRKMPTDEPELPASTKQNALFSKLSTITRTDQSPTVLVIDDAASLRRTLALTLEKAGYRVLQAQDGWEAIDHLKRSSSVELVICDIEMPNMSGFEFLNYRRQDPQLSSIPIAMLTSRSNEKHRWLAMQLGATAYFTKPYLEQEFLAALKNILSSCK